MSWQNYFLKCRPLTFRLRHEILHRVQEQVNSLEIYCSMCQLKIILSKEGTAFQPIVLHLNLDNKYIY